jgi:Transposase DDE domain
VAIDGKTSRRSHNRKTDQKGLHLVSAFATESQLVIGQEAVFEKSSEITAIPALIERLDLKGALVSIDAMGYSGHWGIKNRSHWSLDVTFNIIGSITFAYRQRSQEHGRGPPFRPQSRA